MTLFQGIVLGIVQGIGEFLPISSSAHLIIVPWLFGWDDGGLTFDVALHAGTLIALLIYFRTEWVRLVRGVFRLRLGHVKNPALLDNDLWAKLGLYVVVATVPGALMGLALEKKAEHAFRDPRLIAVTLSFMGIVLWVFDRRGKKQKDLSQMTLGQGFLIGVAQGFAVIPGFSRAGITISAALAQGFDRVAAARFSFFLSMPIIAGACVLKLRHLTMTDITPVFMGGVFAATVAGFISIGALMKYLQTRSYGAFAVYRVLVALGIFAMFFARGL